MTATPYIKAGPPCSKPDCREEAMWQSAYCCPSCARADRGRYEIHEDGPLGHSPECIYWARKRLAEWSEGQR
jgi:hypothetical protein